MAASRSEADTISRRPVSLYELRDAGYQGQSPWLVGSRGRRGNPAEASPRDASGGGDCDQACYRLADRIRSRSSRGARRGAGHPAMSLPCGMVDGLPVGMMLVGKAFDEEPIYRAAAAFE